MICVKCGSTDVVLAGTTNVHPMGTPICRGDCHGPTTAVDAVPADAPPSAPAQPGFISRLIGGRGDEAPEQPE
jgi:hypothetical protein